MVTEVLTLKEVSAENFRRVKSKEKWVHDYTTLMHLTQLTSKAQVVIYHFFSPKDFDGRESLKPSSSIKCVLPVAHQRGAPFPFFFRASFPEEPSRPTFLSYSIWGYHDMWEEPIVKTFFNWGFYCYWIFEPGNFHSVASISTRLSNATWEVPKNANEVLG